MTETVVDVIGAGLLGLGLLLATVGLYGVLRMPEMFHQLHAAGLVTGPAVLVILLASVTTGRADIVTSAALVFVFVLVTAPLAGHSIAQAAWRLADAGGDGPPDVRPRGDSLRGEGMRTLVAYDGSENARRALAVAARLTGDAGSVAVAHVASPLGEPHFAESPDAEDTEQERLLAEARTEVVRGGAPAVTVRLRGDPVTELIDAGAELDADLVVVGSRGRGRVTATLLGSVSAAVAGRAHSPVVVVGPAAEVGEGPIVAAVDGSEGSLEAARVAAALDHRLGLGLEVVHAYAPRPVPGTSAVPRAREELARADEDRAGQLLDETAAQLGVPADATRAVRGRSEASALVAHAREVDAALVVVGSRGQGAVRSALLGSFSTSVLADAPCPVVVVPPGARAPASS